MAGRDPSAGSPFPDVWGIVFSLAVLLIWTVAFLLISIGFAKILPQFHFRANLISLILLPATAFPAGKIYYCHHLKERLENSHLAEIRSRQLSLEQETLYAKLAANPTVVIAERWYQFDREHEARHYVFIKSLNDPKIAYTLPLLEKIYRAAPEARLPIVSHPAADSEFLNRCWADGISLVSSGNDRLLIALIKNPKTPDSLIQTLETSPSFATFKTAALQSAVSFRLYRSLFVLSPSMAVKATVGAARLQIYATHADHRAYEWENATRNVILQRTLNTTSPQSIHFSGTSSIDQIWPHRTVGSEGILTFQSLPEINDWIAAQTKKHPTVYTSDGLCISCDESAEQLTVEIWQILLNGEKPRQLSGANDEAISVTTPTNR